MKQYRRRNKNSQRKKDRLDKYNEVFNPYHSNGEPMRENKLTISTYELRLDEIKSIYNYYKKVITAIITVGIAILGLAAGASSLFCQCGMKQLSCMSFMFALISFILAALGVIFDLILLYQDPERYFSNKYTALKEIMDEISSFADYCARLEEYYRCLIEQYEKEAYRLKTMIKPSVIFKGIAFIFFLVGVLLKII